RSRARRRPTSPASSRWATCRTTSTGRPSLPPVRAAWAPSTPSDTSPRSRDTPERPRSSAARTPSRRRARTTRRSRYGRRVADALPWTDLVDPTEDELLRQLPQRLHPAAMALLRAPPAHEDDPRPRIDSHGDYVVGVLLVAVVVPGQNRVYYQEVD